MAFGQRKISANPNTNITWRQPDHDQNLISFC